MSDTLPPWQNVVGPPGVIVGTAGDGLIATVVNVCDDVQLPIVATTE